MQKRSQPPLPHHPHAQAASAYLAAPAQNGRRSGGSQSSARAESLQRDRIPPTFHG